MNEVALNECEIKWLPKTRRQAAVRLHNWLLIYSQLDVVGQTERARLFGFSTISPSQEVIWRAGGVRCLPLTGLPPGKQSEGAETLVPPSCFFLKMATVAVSG
jgi:hypothetical protein